MEARSRKSAHAGRTASKDLDVKSLETWLWNAACQIRGPLDAPKFKDYILPLVFLKRLSDVFDDEVAAPGRRVRRREDGREAGRAGPQAGALLRPREARWATIATKTTGLGEHLTDAVRAVARENPRLRASSTSMDFNATTAGQRIVDDARLAALVQVLNDQTTGSASTTSSRTSSGRAYEYLLRKFAEGQGSQRGRVLHAPRGRRPHGHAARPAARHDGLRPDVRLRRPAHQVPPAAARDPRRARQRPT